MSIVCLREFHKEKVMGIGQYLNFIHNKMMESTAMKKRINNYICFLVLFLCFLPIFGFEISVYDVTCDKDIIVSLPYIKSEGVTATPIHSRLSVKIDSNSDTQSLVSKN